MWLEERAAASYFVYAVSLELAVFQAESEMLTLKIRMPSVVAVIATVAVLAACGSSSDTDSKPTTSLLLHLTIAEGIDIDEVLWRVSGGEMEDMMGTIDTSASESTASVELFGVPEGSGYVAQMEALTTDGDFFCSGSASFDVVVGVATPVDLTLNCTRECHVLFCQDLEGDCERIDLPDGTSCANGAGSCIGGSCQIPGM
jgi:hypothetical protein